MKYLALMLFLAPAAFADTQASIEAEILADLQRAEVEDPNPGRRAFVASHTQGASLQTLALYQSQAYQAPRNISGQALVVGAAISRNTSMFDNNPLIEAQKQVELQAAWDKALDPIVDYIWSQR